MLMQIRQYPVASRVVARVVQDLGLAESLGWAEDETFDASEPKHWKILSDLVNKLLQEEELESSMER